MINPLQSSFDNLPECPGIYQFLNEKGKIIYVGKSKNLKNRVRSYFHSSHSSVKTAIMVKQINDIRLIQTNNEIEALILENNLIKEYQPRYNILLKDDKSFPYIKITNEPFPRVFATRRVIRDGGKYFGPYTDVKSVKSSLSLINKIFKIRSCKLNLTKEAISANKFSVCLDYHLKKCDAPCVGYQSAEHYNDMVIQAVSLIQGKTAELISELKMKMQRAVDNFEFERAAVNRDQIFQLEALREKQRVVTDDIVNRDIIAIAAGEKEAACAIFVIREGKLIGKREYRLQADKDTDEKEICRSLIQMYYDNEYVEIPSQIIVQKEPAEYEILLKWLEVKADHSVKIMLPSGTKLRSLMKMCQENAQLQLGEIILQKMKREGKVAHSLVALRRDLRLKKLPRKIECFDISHLQGSDTVAGMIVFKDGKPLKSEYRKYIIEGLDEPDDFASMHQVITRRYSRLQDEKKPLPDLILIDGGKGQLSSAIDAINAIGIKEYQIAALAKRLEEVFLPGESESIIIPKVSSALKLLQMVRNEAHRFAVTFHRSRRSKRVMNSELLTIKGFGETTVNKLLKEFGSLKKIREASIEDFARIIGKSKAKILKEFFLNH